MDKKSLLKDHGNILIEGLKDIIVNPRTKKPDLLAINIYIEARSWYKPRRTRIADKIIYSSKLHGKTWETSYAYLSKKHSRSADVIRTKIVLLERLGLLKRDFTYKYINGKLYNNTLNLSVWKDTPFFHSEIGVESRVKTENPNPCNANTKVFTERTPILEIKERPILEIKERPILEIKESLSLNSRMPLLEIKESNICNNNNYYTGEEEREIDISLSLSSSPKNTSTKTNKEVEEEDFEATQASLTLAYGGTHQSQAACSVNEIGEIAAQEPEEPKETASNVWHRIIKEVEIDLTNREIIIQDVFNSGKFKAVTAEEKEILIKTIVNHKHYVDIEEKVLRLDVLSEQWVGFFDFYFQESFKKACEIQGYLLILQSLRLAELKTVRIEREREIKYSETRVIDDNFDLRFEGD